MTPFKAGEVQPLMQPMAIPGGIQGMPGLQIALPAGAVVMAPETTPGAFSPKTRSDSSQFQVGKASEGNLVEAASWQVLPPEFGQLPGAPQGSSPVRVDPTGPQTRLGGYATRPKSRAAAGTAAIQANVSAQVPMLLLELTRALSQVATVLSSFPWAQVWAQGQGAAGGAGRFLGVDAPDAKALHTLEDILIAASKELKKFAKGEGAHHGISDTVIEALDGFGRNLSETADGLMEDPPDEPWPDGKMRVKKILFGAKGLHKAIKVIAGCRYVSDEFLDQAIRDIIDWDTPAEPSGADQFWGQRFLAHAMNRAFGSELEVSEEKTKMKKKSEEVDQGLDQLQNDHFPRGR